jgi:hypothetical protein
MDIIRKKNTVLQSGSDKEDSVPGKKSPQAIVRDDSRRIREVAFQRLNLVVAQVLKYLPRCTDKNFFTSSIIAKDFCS